MKRIGSFLILLIAIFFLGPAAFAEMHFTAQVNKNELGLDDNLTLQLVLSTDGNANDEEEPRLPSLEGFELLNKWSQNQSSSVYENGQFKYERKFIFNYQLSPQKKGSLLIGPAEIRIGGQVLKSQPIKIAVLDAGNGKLKKKPSNQDDEQTTPFGDDDDNDLFAQLLKRRGLGVPRQNSGGSNSAQGGQQVPSQTSPGVNTKDPFFISVEVNKKKAFVGEELIATWYLYARGKSTRLLMR